MSGGGGDGQPCPGRKGGSGTSGKRLIGLWGGQAALTLCSTASTQPTPEEESPGHACPPGIMATDIVSWGCRNKPPHTSGFKQQRFILSKLWTSKSEISYHWTQMKASAGLMASGSSGEKSFLLVLASGGCHGPLAVALCPLSLCLPP